MKLDTQADEEHRKTQLLPLSRQWTPPLVADGFGHDVDRYVLGAHNSKSLSLATKFDVGVSQIIPGRLIPSMGQSSSHAHGRKLISLQKDCVTWGISVRKGNPYLFGRRAAPV